MEDLKTHLDKCHYYSMLPNANIDNTTRMSTMSIPSSPAAAPAALSQSKAGCELSEASWTVNLNDGKGKATTVGPTQWPTQSQFRGADLADGQVSFPVRKVRRPPQVTATTPSANLDREELQKTFGKYASNIRISNESFYYCQVCMFKTSCDEDFHAHFSCDEHRRTVLKLEQPWTQPFSWSRDQGLQDNRSKVKLSPDLPITHWGMDPQRSRPRKKKRRKMSTAPAGWEQTQGRQSEDLFEDLSAEEEGSQSSDASAESDEDTSSVSATPDLQAVAKSAAQSAIDNIQSQACAQHDTSASCSVIGSLSNAADSKCVRCAFTYQSYAQYYKHCAEVHGDKYLLDPGFGEIHKMTLIKSHVQSMCLLPY